MDILAQMEKFMEKYIDPVAGDLSLTDDQFKYIERYANAMFAYGVVWASALSCVYTNVSLLQESEMFGMRDDTMSEVFTHGLFHEKEMVDWLKEKMSEEKVD